MRVKVLSALAAGKATVATSLAVEGMGVKTDLHALIADDSASFVAGIDRLLRDEGYRAKLGRAARAHVTETRSWDRSASAYEALYDHLTTATRDAR